MTNFNYGEVVSLKLKFADCPSTHECYCVDKATAGVVRILAEQSSFPAWEKLDPNIWFRKEPENSLWISMTSRGWLAFRGYRSVEKTLTHQVYVMPILLPDPALALAAAELCYPRPHPALCWLGAQPECITDAQYGSALGNVGWERTLREDAWLVAARWDKEQVPSTHELDEALSTPPKDWINPTGVVH